MRTQKVAVAIVECGVNNFLVTYNPKWHGYAFPMKAVEDDEPVLASMAVDAVRADLGLPLSGATVKELEHFTRCDSSQRTGEKTYYQYFVFAVDPGESLGRLPKSSQPHPPLSAPYAALLFAKDITWSTAAIVRDFVENQQVALSVVARPGERETEFLLVDNKNYGGFFFPCQRIKSEVKPEQWAEHTVRHELGYHGEIDAAWRAEVPDVHFSNRYFRDRRFRFHVCEVRLPGLDIHLPYNALERGLVERRKDFRWLSASALTAATNLQPSPTVAAILPTIEAVLPPQTLPRQLRTSEGGIALISRPGEGGREWLCQWNEGWNAYFLIGGHREPGESFRDCVVREIDEELGLSPAECPVVAAAAHCLTYKAHSRSAGELTAYTMELYEAQPTASAMTKIAADPLNRCLTEAEIRRLGAADGRNVSETVLSVLGQAGRIAL